MFKTINLIRMDPNWVIPYLNNITNHKNYTGADIDLVLNRLKSSTSLPAVEISLLGNMACR